MQVAVRSYLTAGITMMGAGAIALAPAAQSLPAVHLPSVREAEVQLSAAAGPLETWAGVVEKAVTNVSQIGQQVAADPAPILQKVISNQLANAAVLGSAGEETLTALTAFAQSLGTSLPTALGQIADGDITGAEETLLNVGTLLSLLTIIQGPTDAFQVVTNTAQNAANFLTTVNTFVATEGLALTGPVWSAANALAVTGQAVVDDTGAGDAEAVVNTLLNAPAVLTGAVLNGYGAGPLGLPAGGLFTSLDNPTGELGAGPIAAALNLRKAFADALKALPTPAAAATTSIESPTVTKALPAASTSVALSTGPTTATSTAVKDAPTADTASKLGAVRPDRTKTVKTANTGDTATATPVSGKPTPGKHRAQADNPIKKLGDNIKKALGSSGKTTEKSKAGASAGE